MNRGLGAAGMRFGFGEASKAFFNSRQQKFPASSKSRVAQELPSASNNLPSLSKQLA